jgi:integrase
MSNILHILRRVNENVNDFTLKPKRKYSDPKIYTGGLDIAKWSKYSKAEQEIALQKNWFVYFSFRNPKTGFLEKQPFIKGGVNHYKTKEERIEILETYRRNLSRILKEGYNPYEASGAENEIKSVKEAFVFGLGIKKNMMTENSYIRFKSRIKRFELYLESKGFTNRFITSVDKSIVLDYLNMVLDTSSARNRNNTRTDISSLFQVLEDNDVIASNFVSKLKILKATPKRNKSYSENKLERIYQYLEQEDPNLLLFIKFVSYNFLRPIEVCRLKVEDINLREMKLTVKAKNKLVKEKIIPSILVEELSFLSKYKDSDFLFTPKGEPSDWDATDDNRRDYFTKKFKQVKDLFTQKAKDGDKNYFELNSEYGIYSFRHTFITKIYREMRKTLSPFETKSRLLLITGHNTMAALEKYLRDIDAELPEDYSDLIK